MDFDVMELHLNQHPTLLLSQIKSFFQVVSQITPILSNSRLLFDQFRASRDKHFKFHVLEYKNLYVLAPWHSELVRAELTWVRSPVSRIQSSCGA